MTYELIILDLFVLYFYVSSSIADKMDRHCFAASYPLDSIAKPVNEAATTGNATVLMKYYSEHKGLLAVYGPEPHIYIQMADCMALMYELNQDIELEPKYDSTLNLFEEILKMPELSDYYFILVARRYIAFLSLRGNLGSIIGVQKKIVERYPQSLGDLSRLGEMLYAVEHKTDVQDVFGRMLDLDQYIGENVDNDQIVAMH